MNYRPYWLWGLAERMEWNNRFPHRFWGWLLRKMDEHHGYRLEYDEMGKPNAKWGRS